MGTIYISDATHRALTTAAEVAQEWFEHEQGTHYSVDTLRAALVSWLESSIEQLAEDAPYHCFEGDGVFAFNRKGFKDQLNQRAPEQTAEETDQLAA